MKKTIYFVSTVLLNVVVLFVFGNHMNLTGLSILPIAVIALIAFQAIYFLKEPVQREFHTAYNTGKANDDDYEKLYHLVGNSMLCFIPLIVPTIFFFQSSIKCILSIALYICSPLSGRIIFHIKYGKEMNSRINSEDKELEEQRKKEEFGK